MGIISNIKCNINYFFYKSFKNKTVNDFKLINPKIFNLSDNFDMLFFHKTDKKLDINVDNFIEKYELSKYNKISELKIRDFGKNDLSKSFYKFLRYDISDKNILEVLDIFLQQNKFKKSTAVDFEKACSVINYLLHRKQNYCYSDVNGYFVSIAKFGNNKFIISFNDSAISLDSVGLDGTYNKIKNKNSKNEK